MRQACPKCPRTAAGLAPPCLAQTLTAIAAERMCLLVAQGHVGYLGLVLAETPAATTRATKPRLALGVRQQPVPGHR